MIPPQEKNTGMDLERLIACPECDLLLRRIHVRPKVKAICPRCRSLLFQVKPDPVERTLILSLTGLILFVPAMILPIMRLNALGLEQSAGILQWVSALFRTGFSLVGLVVLLTVAVIPLVKLTLLFHVSMGIRMGTGWKILGPSFRIYHHMDEWGMLEISTLGILVSIIKLKDMAQISYGTGLLCFALLMIVSLWASNTLDQHEYWALMKRRKSRTGSDG
ncbi:MAG TPA: paraquat-inducible protein A [Deltaproteobacteria bacterium]|nr:paraquat-inducible protein A [Deltaproteobacteria bacterium]